MREIEIKNVGDTAIDSDTVGWTSTLETDIDIDDDSLG
jgi:hypothetical protein